MSIAEKKAENAGGSTTSREVSKGDGIWVKLSNRTRARKSLIAAISSNSENGWILLKNAQDDILCGIQHADTERFQAELESIDAQMD